MKSLESCQAWRELMVHFTSDLRRVVQHAPETSKKAQIWLTEALALLKREGREAQVIGAEVLSRGVLRLKHRHIPDHDLIHQEVIRLIEATQHPSHQTRLILLLHELTPLGSGQLFKDFVKPKHSPAVQEIAWRILAQRQSPQEPLSIKAIKDAMYRAESTAVKASIIRAAGLIKSPLIVRWCGQKWWQTSLFKNCRDALTRLGTERATHSLWRWAYSLFTEVDQVLNHDTMLAESLSHLSYGHFSPRLKRRYIDLLDRFFSRKRTEEAAVLVARSWLHITPKRFAMKILLRYLKPKEAHIVSQTHTFKSLLKHLIHVLNQP